MAQPLLAQPLRERDESRGQTEKNRLSSLALEEAIKLNSGDATTPKETELSPTASVETAYHQQVEHFTR